MDALSRALELPVERVRSAASESYKRLSKSWGTGLIPHANIILHPDERPGHGFILLLRRVDTRIDFKPNSRPKTFVKQAVEALRERNLKRRKFHSLVVNYAWGQAVRVDADGNEIERLGDEEPK